MILNHGLLTDKHSEIRVERQALRTGNGIAFHVKRTKMALLTCCFQVIDRYKLNTPSFIELSGVIDYNSCESKSISDEVEMVEQFVRQLNCQNAVGENFLIQYYIHYYDSGNLYVNIHCGTYQIPYRK